MYNETTRLVKVVMPDYGQDEPPVNGGGNHPILYSVNQIQPSDPVGGGDIMLSDTAENLFIAYEVVAMVKDEETGKTHFSQLKWKRLGTADGGDDDGDEPIEGGGGGEAKVMKSVLGSATPEESDEPQLVYEFMFESGDLFVAYAADEYPALDGDELQMLNDSSSGGGSTGGGVLAVHANEVTGVFDKTWQEIYEADFAVLQLVIGDSVQFANVSFVGSAKGAYAVEFVGAEPTEDGVEHHLYAGVTDSPDGYPVMQGSGGGGGGNQV